MKLVCGQCGEVNGITRPDTAAVCQRRRKQLFPGRALALTDETFQRHLRIDETPLLVDFWAPWCGPCRQMGRAIEQAARELAPDIRCAKLNIDDYTSRVQEYPIQGAWIFVESKAQKRRHSGATSSFCNAAIGEKTRAMNGVFLIARSISQARENAGCPRHSLPDPVQVGARDRPPGRRGQREATGAMGETPNSQHNRKTSWQKKISLPKPEQMTDRAGTTNPSSKFSGST
ncbi:MAG TPA: hypothetical protein ENK26_06640 [Gammaproteobacteria bacterium]|nr:hypothetical protein [Gammaproteobacteria bacterium]